MTLNLPTKPTLLRTGSVATPDQTGRQPPTLSAAASVVPTAAAVPEAPIVAGAVRFMQARSEESDLFVLSPDDLLRWVVVNPQDPEDQRVEMAQRVCDRISVDALARDESGGNTTLVVSFKSIFRENCSLFLRFADVVSDSIVWRNALANHGFNMPSDRQISYDIREYLLTRKTAPHGRLTSRTGWNGNVFVFADRTIVPTGYQGEPVYFFGMGTKASGCQQSGTLPEWQERIAAHCRGQNFLMFAISVSFASPLLRWAGNVDCGIFHLFGASSTGKTTVARVAASVWGDEGFFFRWRTTGNGLESVASSRSELGLIVDEIGQLNPQDVGSIVYMLGNGRGKTRATSSGGHSPAAHWRFLGLSTGEVSLAEQMGEAGKTPTAGQEVRFADLEADAHTGFGVFDHLSSFKSADELARHLNGAAAAAFGSAGMEWVRYLCDHAGEVGDFIRAQMDNFLTSALPDGAQGQVQRVANRFALVSAAGELATRSGLTGWEPGESCRAATAMFNNWLSARSSGSKNSESVRMLEQLQAWFAIHGRSRFAPWGQSSEDPASLGTECAGWRRGNRDESLAAGVPDGSDGEWCVLPAVFKNEIAKGLNYRAALRALHKAGFLHKEKADGFSCSINIPGHGHSQAFRIKRALLRFSGAASIL